MLYSTNPLTNYRSVRKLDRPHPGSGIKGQSQLDLLTDIGEQELCHSFPNTQLRG